MGRAFVKLGLWMQGIWCKFPSGLDMLGIKAVSLGVTGAALLAVNFVYAIFYFV